MLPAGGYGFTVGTVAYTLGGQRRTSGGLALTAGSFWSGDIRTLEYRQGRINVLNQFSIEPTISFNDIDLPKGTSSPPWSAPASTTRSTRACSSAGSCSTARAPTAGATTCDCVGSTVRAASCSWYTREERDLEALRPSRCTGLRNRGFVVKFNRLFQL